MHSVKLVLFTLTSLPLAVLFIAQSPPATAAGPADAMEGLAAVYSDKLNGRKTVIDLSSAAAAKIGIRKIGTAPVKLEVVSEPSARKP